MQEIEPTSFFFFNKALKRNSQVGPTKNFLGDVKIEQLYMLQVYSWI